LLLSYCLFRAVGVALLLATVIIGGVVSFAGGQAAKPARQNLAPRSRPAMQGPAEKHEAFSGVVTDSTCGARHNKFPDKSSTECARACIRKGARYVLVNGESVYQLNGRQAELSRVAGERAKISGTRHDDVIQVASVSVQ
jgi:hypothetical protein